MANPKLLHLFSILVFYSLVVFELASARPWDGAKFHGDGLIPKPFLGEKNQEKLSEKTSGITTCHDELETQHGIKKDDRVEGNHRKLGLRYRPLLMDMLPKGTIPASGPSRKTNDAKN